MHNLSIFSIMFIYHTANYVYFILLFSIDRLINQEKLEALIQEQERLIVEEHLEDIQKQKQEQEEADTAQLPASELNDVSGAEDPEDPGEITNQEKEEKPCDVTTDDETRVSSHLKHSKDILYFPLNIINCNIVYSMYKILSHKF